MNSKTRFLPLLLANVSGYSIAVSPVTEHSQMMDDLYAKDARAVARFDVITRKGNACTVELVYSLNSPPIPYGYGVNGEDGGELSFESVAACAAHVRKVEAGTVELVDFDGASCLPKVVCAVLRAHGFTVSDDNLSSPL